ncbi:MAG: hypothetical protein ACXVWV_15090 [Nocardioides sp.]
MFTGLGLLLLLVSCTGVAALVSPTGPGRRAAASREASARRPGSTAYAVGGVGGVGGVVPESAPRGGRDDLDDLDDLVLWELEVLTSDPLREPAPCVRAVIRQALAERRTPRGGA